ncbi:hypothetical protein CQA78_09205 [Klebsiella pneumoniae]|nr:hypothetical protein CQA15_21475 [Klebsiella pneumoniae]PCP32353.1 hypothetical protein CQA17_21665 [Klebsiella pneumoniae]PCP48204.1 hypothetical protein CQA39_21660 [Klebsiella pneumoniae]PCR80106.1 hypothetical protein CQA78_09205 [Klebsiella pneumoniae]
MFAGKKSAQIREILISESAWEEMTCLFAPSLTCPYYCHATSSLLPLLTLHSLHMICRLAISRAKCG